MFSRKRLAYILIITMIFSLLFFLFNWDHAFFRSQATNPFDDFVPTKLLDAQLNTDADAGYLIVGDPQNATEERIKANVRFTLDQIKAEVTEVSVLTDSEYASDSIIIFIVQDISLASDLQRLAITVTSGRRVIFAAGIPLGSTFRYLDPLWGILERGSLTPVSDITFNTGYFPYESMTASQAYPTSALTVRLDDTVEVLVQGPEALPLVWAHPYRLGRIAVINGSFLESKLSSGLLIGALNTLKEHALYPVFGTKVVVLDAIPPLFDSNDDKSFDYYGRSAESFVRDKLWSVLVQKATLLDLKLTSSFLAIDKLKFDAQNANQQTFSGINREILRYGGEITLSGNHVELESLTLDRIAQTETFFSGFFPNYTLRAYTPLYGKIEPNQLELIRTVYPSMDVLRLLVDGDGITQSSGDYGVQGDMVIYPTTTYGYIADGKQLYTFISMLTTYGAVSHSFDINALFTVPSSESNWNTLNKPFDDLSERFFAKTPWLNSMTISPAAQKVRDLSMLQVDTSTEATSMMVACQNLTAGQAFMFYSKTPIVRVEGAQYTRINESYYLIEAESASFTIYY